MTWLDIRNFSCQKRMKLEMIWLDIRNLYLSSETAVKDDMIRHRQVFLVEWGSCRRSVNILFLTAQLSTAFLSCKFWLAFCYPVNRYSSLFVPLCFLFCPADSLTLGLWEREIRQVNGRRFIGGVILISWLTLYLTAVNWLASYFTLSLLSVCVCQWKFSPEAAVVFFWVCVIERTSLLWIFISTSFYITFNFISLSRVIIKNRLDSKHIIILGEKFR